jgi:hypothetical protein
MPDVAIIKDVLIIIALLVLIGREALRWHDQRRGTASDGRSGDKSPAYWEKAIGELVRDALEEYDERVKQPERIEAANERRQINVKLTQLASAFEMSVQEKQRQLAEAIVEIKRQLRDSNNH